MTNFVTYLDHHASASLLPAAREAMNAMFEIVGNPSSVHANGRKLRAAIETARDQVALAAGTIRSRVVFTGSATEALTQAIVGGAKSQNVSRILFGSGEHMAVVRAVEATEVQAQAIPMLANGLYDLDWLSAAIATANSAEERVMVVVQQVNNETAVVQPIAHIEDLMRETAHLLILDAAQGFGKTQFFFDPSRVDAMAISGHKIGGPVGVGALIVKPAMDSAKLIPGGGQEQGRRGGTESAALIAGFGVAAQSAKERFDAVRQAKLIEIAQAGLLKIAPDATIFGGDVERTGTAMCFAVPELKNNISLINYDLDNVALSAGSACSSGKVSRSHVLSAMGVDDAIADCALRLSVGWNSTGDDIERFLAVTKKLVARHHQKRGAAA
ncbi:cysteine desulfurase family protein [Maritalea sp.]|jgi:cysteine desulfurase|uniref:cysteine desulfurase family protein n=1 Tax=Maritalea sp. TaxID=2003361 RepID=UPI0039E2B7FD